MNNDQIAPHYQVPFKNLTVHHTRLTSWRFMRFVRQSDI